MFIVFWLRLSKFFSFISTTLTPSPFPPVTKGSPERPWGSCLKKTWGGSNQILSPMTSHLYANDNDNVLGIVFLFSLASIMPLIPHIYLNRAALASFCVSRASWGSTLQEDLCGYSKGYCELLLQISKTESSLKRFIRKLLKEILFGKRSITTF